MVAFDNRPKTETGHPLSSFLNDQSFGTVVCHVEPNALVLADLGNLDKSLLIQMPRVNGLYNFNEINADLIKGTKWVTWGSTG